MANITKLENQYCDTFISRRELLDKLKSTFSLPEILRIYHDIDWYIGSIENPYDDRARNRTQLVVLEYIFDRQQHEIQQP